MFDTLKNVLKRGAYQNMKITVQHSGIVGALTILYLFLLQQGEEFSRFTLVMTFILYIILTYLVRELWKRLLRKQWETGTAGSLLIAITKYCRRSDSEYEGSQLWKTPDCRSSHPGSG